MRVLVCGGRKNEAAAMTAEQRKKLNRMSRENRAYYDAWVASWIAEVKRRASARQTVS